jgi:Protein of unknown function (DUF1285)
MGQRLWPKSLLPDAESSPPPAWAARRRKSKTWPRRWAPWAPATASRRAMADRRKGRSPQWNNGIRRFAAISTCGSRATGRGFITARRLTGPPWCDFFRRFCARSLTASSCYARRESRHKGRGRSFPCGGNDCRASRSGPGVAIFDQCRGLVRGGFHPIRFEKAACDGIKPYVHVRGDLWALVARALVLDLVELGEIGEHDGARCFGVVSAGSFFQWRMPMRSRRRLISS